MRRAAVWLAPAILIAAVARGQETAASSRPDPAAALLAQIDARIYSAERAGLKAVEISYHPPTSGPLELAAFRVRARWEKGDKETVEFQKPDGSALTGLPELLSQKPAADGSPGARERFEQGAKNLLAVFRGVPYSEQFRNWRKRIEPRIVNGREERMIVLEPHVVRYIRRVEMSLDRRDLPWRIVSFLNRSESAMDRMIDEPTWDEFDGSLLMTGFKKERGAESEQIVLNYQRKDGFIVPASYEQLVPGKPPKRIVFDTVVLSK